MRRFSSPSAASLRSYLLHLARLARGQKAWIHIDTQVNTLPKGVTLVSPWRQRPQEQPAPEKRRRRSKYRSEDQVSSKPIHRRFNPGSRAKALVVFLETRDRVPGPNALRIIIESLQLEDGYSLPWILLQFMVRTEAHHAARLTRKHLAHDEIWQHCLELRASQGITLSHIENWACILVHNRWDERIDRFVQATDVPRPHFLLNILLHKGNQIWSRSSLVNLIDHVTVTYCRLRHQDDRAQNRHPAEPDARNLPSLDPAYFLEIFTDLVHHCLRVFPDLMYDVAAMAAEYIRNSAGYRHPGQLFALRCRLFNSVLHQLAFPAAESTLTQRRSQWGAQRKLLDMSQEETPPLLLGKLGLTAIRKVLVGLGKSAHEIRLVTRSSSTWPPYMKPQDGIDERTAPEEMISRAGVAGVVSREAGFSDDPLDRALDILAGGAPGSLPATQTRTLPPPDVIVQEDNLGRRPGAVRSPFKNPRTRVALQEDVTWAARIRTARNTREAWAQFQRSETPGAKPWITAYTQLLRKYLTREVTSEEEAQDPYSPSSTRSLRTKKIIAGDYPWVAIPPDMSKMSEYEHARTEPPSVSEVFQMMRQSGVRAGLGCLCALVELSESFDQAVYYLRESGSVYFQEDAQTLYRVISNMLQQHPERPHDTFSIAYHDYSRKLRKVPTPLFLALTRLSCKLQSSYTRGFHHAMPEALPAMRYIHIAIQLVRMRQGFNITGRDDTRACWHVVLRTLSRSEIFVSPQPMPYKAVANLRLFLRSWCIFSASHPVDPRKFTYLAKVVENVGVAFLLNGPLYYPKQLIWRSCRALNFTFELLASQWERVGHGADGRDVSYFLLGPQGSHHYLRAMGLLGGQEMHMAYAVYLMLTHKFNDEAAMHRILCAFRAFAEPILLRSDDEQAQLMIEKLQELADGGTELEVWPTDEQVSDYIFGVGGTASDVSVARAKQILSGDSWWKTALGRQPERDGLYVRRHRPLGDAVEDLVWWKSSIRGELQGTVKPFSWPEEEGGEILKELDISWPGVDHLLEQHSAELEPEEEGTQKWHVDEGATRKLKLEYTRMLRRKKNTSGP